MSLERGRWRTMDAIVRPVGDGRIELRSPAPGWFVLASEGSVVLPGAVVGLLEVLGRPVRVVVPGTAARGVLLAPARHTTTRMAVGHGDVLAVIDPSGAQGITGHWTDQTSPSAAGEAAGLVFASPTSGRFYSRPSPDKPPFVSVGAELTGGATICLLEVMKTFHRVGYGGAGLPERARVRAVLVEDGADVNAGDPLVAIEPV